MLMGFILHIYIIFGTNLLTGGPTQNCYFLPISVFRRNGISNGVQVKKQPEPPRDRRAPPCRARPCLVGPSGVHRRTSSSYIYLRTPKTSTGTTKHNFHHRKLLYPRYPILELSPALCRRENQPWRASTSTSLPLL